jgi:hypothetical protein
MISSQKVKGVVKLILLEDDLTQGEMGSFIVLEQQSD